MGEIKEECTSLDKSEQEKQLHSKVSKVALYSSGESKAIAIATNGLCEENVIDEGGYRIVYHGLFPDGTKIAGDLDLICPKIILGSSSKARREILAEMGYEFTVMTADIDEKGIRREKPEDLVMALVEAKIQLWLQEEGRDTVDNNDVILQNLIDDEVIFVLFM
ncbi:hypothetical protein JHK86_032263 [Glycine max]|nr:hypothetical protein JHK86_032263 [Glycine max]